MNYRGALVVRVDAIRVLGEQVLITLSRQSSALVSTEPMPTARQVEGLVLGDAQASPGFPTRGCSDLSAERKLQPLAVAV